MSSKKTSNMSLHSWLPTDFFDVDEINSNFTKLDKLGNTYVVERGTKRFNDNNPELGEWIYRKWNNGMVEFWFKEKIKEISTSKKLDWTGKDMGSRTTIWQAYGPSGMGYSYYKTNTIPNGIVDTSLEGRYLLVYSASVLSQGTGLYFCHPMAQKTDHIELHIATVNTNAKFTGWVLCYGYGWWK